MGESQNHNNSWNIAFGGNAFITTKCGPEVITDHGLGNWMSNESICSLMFHLHPQETIETLTFDFALRLNVPNNGKSSIKVKCMNQEYILDLKGESAPFVIPVGQFQLTNNSTQVTPTTTKCQHHIQIDLQGISTNVGFFADVSHGIISNPSSNIKLSFVHEDFSFHFGRRGPSVHLNYRIPSSNSNNTTTTKANVQYFYNEVLIPKDSDIIGSYFCAIGFSGGYFGIQVNSSTERRILFSIWSLFDTDCPEQIPTNYKVRLLTKGEHVKVQPFGCEGSGQQSIRKYNWTSGQKYGFLVCGSPVENSKSTIFTAWFKAIGIGEANNTNTNWELIASFERPMKSSYLESIYSFSENFEPEHGHLVRTAYFMNPWAYIVNDNKWIPITTIKFTGDDTSKKCRKDYCGGVDSLKQYFYLQNCGFLCHRVETGQEFSCDIVNYKLPEIAFETLP